MLLRSISFATALAGIATAGVNVADINGQQFVDTTTKNRLMVVGVDYQPGAQAGFNPESKDDILSDEKVCLRDAALLQKLGVNAIRVYNIKPTVNHDACMSVFNAAGIYVIIDVNSPFMSINREEPWTTYNPGYAAYIFSVVENFKGYPNTLAFFAANEVMNDMATGKENPRYIRAVQRDLRQYIAKHSKRHIPVGYSAADVRPILKDTWAYLQCNIDGKTDISRSEFFGLNSYSWCGAEATYTTAGYNVLADMFKGSSIPVFFSEYGCNKPAGVPRVFNEVQALYGPDMSMLSGGLVYEYSQEEADYGLVEINKDGSLKLRNDFDNLQAQYNKLDVKLLQAQASASSGGNAPSCDASVITDAAFSKNFTLPVQLPEITKLIESGVQNAVQGKIIDIKSFAVTFAVTGSNGKPIKDLAVKEISGSNMPSGQATSQSGSGGGGSDKKKGAAARLGEHALGSAIVGLMAVAAVMAVGL